MNFRPIEHAFLEFAEGRGTLVSDFATFKKARVNAGVGLHGSWTAAFLADVGLSADDRAAWLHFQRNGAMISPADYLPENRVRLAA